MQSDGARPAEQVTTQPDLQRWWFGLERKWWVLIAVGVGTFMGALDGAVVNTVLPLILNSFHSSISSVEWVAMAYLLTVASLLLTFGRLGDMLGHKRVYVGGFTLFIVGSALCGIAPNEWWLVGLRAFQALGAAMLVSNSPAILTNAFPATQRGQALGMQGTMTYLGLMVGPALGGIIADRFGWPWIFYVNVPIGIAATLLALAVIPTTKAAKKAESFDPAGALAITTGLVLLLLALSQGQGWGWSSPAVIGMIVVAIVLLVSFVWVEQRVKFPMVDLTLFANRMFSSATAAALINYICVYAAIFLMPFYLIQGRGFSTTDAGLILTGMSLTMAVIAPLSGSLSDKIGSRLPSTIGMAILTASLLVLAMIGPHTSSTSIVLRLVLTGLGVGIFVSPNSSALLGAAPPQQRGVASGVMGMARNVGMVLGIAVAGATFNAGLAHVTPAGQQLAIFDAIRDAFLVAASIAVLGTAVSLVRGPVSVLTGRNQAIILEKGKDDAEL